MSDLMNEFILSKFLNQSMYDLDFINDLFINKIGTKDYLKNKNEFIANLKTAIVQKIEPLLKELNTYQVLTVYVDLWSNYIEIEINHFKDLKQIIKFYQDHRTFRCSNYLSKTKYHITIEEKP